MDDSASTLSLRGLASECRSVSPSSASVGHRQSKCDNDDDDVFDVCDVIAAVAVVLLIL